MKRPAQHTWSMISSAQSGGGSRPAFFLGVELIGATPAEAKRQKKAEAVARSVRKCGHYKHGVQKGRGSLMGPHGAGFLSRCGLVDAAAAGSELRVTPGECRAERPSKLRRPPPRLAPLATCTHPEWELPRFLLVPFALPAEPVAKWPPTRGKVVGLMFGSIGA